MSTMKAPSAATLKNRTSQDYRKLINFTLLLYLYKQNLNFWYKTINRLYYLVKIYNQDI